MEESQVLESTRPRLRLGGIAVPLAAATLLAVSSQLRVPIPGSPVPMTLQVVVVLLAGGFLAPGAAAAATVIFAAAGLAGLPVFQGGGAGMLHLAGPTGGYILGFVVAAPAVAWILAGRRDSIARVALAMAAGIGIIHLCGMTQLAVWLSGDVRLAFMQGVVPFLPLDLVKIAVAAPIVSGFAGLRD